MNALMVRIGKRYRMANKQEVLESAAQYVCADIVGTRVSIESPGALKQHLNTMLRGFEYEVFGCIYLDDRHRVIACEHLFRGTIDGASVHPREVVKSALTQNAAAVVLYHNHPSGVCEPSQADELITRRLREALALVDIRVLDHMIVAGTATLSFAERGLL